MTKRRRKKHRKTPQRKPKADNRSKRSPFPVVVCVVPGVALVCTAIYLVYQVIETGNARVPFILVVVIFSAAVIIVLAVLAWLGERSGE